MRKIKAEQPPQPRHSVSPIPTVYHVLVTTVCQQRNDFFSVLAGVFLGLLVSQLFALSLPLCFIPGVGLFLVILVAQLRYQYTQWRDTIGQLKVLFPKDA